MSTDLPQPTATGTLAKTPLAHLLVYAQDRELTGTFAFAGPTGQSATVLFIEGQPTKARTSEAAIYLGRVLFELGIVSEEQLAGLLPRLLAGTELHGQVLLHEGVITEEQLELGLRSQLVRQMQSLVRLPPETTYNYYDCFDGLASYGGDGHVGIDPFPVVWACIRDEPQWEHVQVGLRRVGAHGLQLTTNAETSRFSFDKAERATVELLRQRPWRVQELTAAATLAPRLVQLLAYCLLVTKQVELVRESRLPDAPRSVDAVPDSAPSAPSVPNILDTPGPPLKVARLQLAQRPATRAPAIVEDHSAASLAPEGEDGRTSYVATQPRSFKRRPVTKPDAAMPSPADDSSSPMAIPPDVSSGVSLANINPAAPALSAPPVVEVAPPEPAAAVATAAPPDAEQEPDARSPGEAATTAPMGAAPEEVRTAPPPTSSAGKTQPPPAEEVASGGDGDDIFRIPTPAVGMPAVEVEPAVDVVSAVESAPGGQVASAVGVAAHRSKASAPVAEVHTRPTVPKLTAVSPEQIAAHLASMQPKPPAPPPHVEETSTRSGEARRRDRPRRSLRCLVRCAPRRSR